MAEYNFEGNSLKSRREQSSNVREKMNSVVSEKPIMAKKKWRLIDCFPFVSNDKSFSEWIIKDMLIPNINRAIGTTLHGVITKIFGVGSGYSTTFKTTNDWYNYGRGESYVEYSARASQAKSMTNKPQQTNVSTDLESYVLRTREDAERVLEGLDAYIEAYDSVPVSAFFELIGITAPYTYHDFGWTNLSEAKVITNENGYSIRFPRPTRIK